MKIDAYYDSLKLKIYNDFLSFIFKFIFIWYLNLSKNNDIDNKTAALLVIKLKQQSK